jgi:nicotinate-nucleotide adenylyltransferase
MVRLAIAGNPVFTVSDTERHRPGASYSVDTITVFRNQLEQHDDLLFIIGADQFCELETWRDYSRLFSLCDFIVMTRPQFDPRAAPVIGNEGLRQDPDEPNCFHHPSGHSLYLYRVTPMDISATAIRTTIREGRSIAYLVPDCVAEYITSHGLYR